MIFSHNLLNYFTFLFRILENKHDKNIGITEPLTPIATHLQANKPTTLYFSEKMRHLVGNSGKIKDGNGNTVFEIKAVHWTFSNRRFLLDSKGNTLGQFRRKNMCSMNNIYYFGPINDEKRCAVKLKGMLNPLKCEADIYIGKEIIGKALGSWKLKMLEIEVFHEVVAIVDRKKTLKSTSMDEDTCCVKIIKGVDTAFITLVIMALDMFYDDDETIELHWY